jgi:hypothetical protein
VLLIDEITLSWWQMKGMHARQWNDTDNNTEVPEQKNLSQCHFIYQKFHTD